MLLLTALLGGIVTMHAVTAMLGHDPVHSPSAAVDHHAMGGGHTDPADQPCHGDSCNQRHTGLHGCAFVMTAISFVTGLALLCWVGMTRTTLIPLQLHRRCGRRQRAPPWTVLYPFRTVDSADLTGASRMAARRERAHASTPVLIHLFRQFAKESTMFTSSTTAKTVIAVAAAAAALMVAGCSDNTSSTSASPTTSSSPGMSGSMPGMDHGGSSASAAPSATRSDFNDADVMFLQMMYPHHAQAVDMAKLVAGRSQNQQVITLAANIEKAQAPEMDQMTTLLQSFGKPAPAADMDMGHTMPGMMTAEQMTTLNGLSGAAFDRMWLQMMIDHHTGAIDMANTELSDGTNPDAKKLAQAIIAIRP